MTEQAIENVMIGWRVSIDDDEEEDDRMSDLSDEGRNNNDVERVQAVPQNIGNVDEPQDDDVLHGRGSRIYDRPGNKWLREEHLPRYIERYDSAVRAAKRAVAQEALADVHATGRRFFERTGSGGWVVASTEQNVKKIMDDLRHL